MDYRLRVREREYDIFNSYANNIINNPSNSEQRDYFEQKILYGRVITLKFKLCHEYCGSCDEFGTTYDEQYCKTCLPDYLYDYWYYKQVYIDNCMPEGYYYDRENRKLVQCNETNSKFYLNLTDNKRICFKNTYRCPDEYPFLNETNKECVNLTFPVQTTLPEVPTTIPLIPTTIPIIPTTIPILPTTIPKFPTTIPQIITTLVKLPTTIPEILTTIPRVQTTIPKLPTTFPQIITTIPEVLTYQALLVVSLTVDINQKFFDTSSKNS